MHLKRLSAAFAIMVLIAAGCSKNPATSENSSTTDLTAAFGGYTTQSESPSFADDGLSDMAASEAVANDPLQSNSEVNGWHQLPGAGVYHIRFVWGRLTFDSTATVVTTWDGSLESNRGALVARRILRFEDGDYLKPRTDRRLVEWVSKTRPHHDGLAVDLVVPPARPTIDTAYVVDSTGTDTSIVIDTLLPEPVKVTFATAPFTIELNERQLTYLDTVIDLGDGLSVSINSVRHLAQRCPRGMLAGQFGVNDSGVYVFRGMWLDPRGLATGTFRGHLGVDSLGHPMFFGKWIDASGNFEGLLRGRYQIKHEGDSLHPKFFGRFGGTIFDAQGMPIGELKGRFCGSREMQTGYLGGRWKIKCPSDSVDDDSEGESEENFEDFADVDGDDFNG